MKVKTDIGVRGMNGKMGKLVYYTLPNCDFTIGRSKPEHFTEAVQHNDYRLVAQNLRNIKPSAEFKNDFKVYATLYKDLPEAQKSVSSWYNLYISMLWTMQKAGMVNLKTLTRQQIYDNDLPCKSVKSAVQAGLLPPVLNYTTLDNGI